MSQNRKTGPRRAARIAGLGAAAAVALGLMSTGAANADTFVPLSGGEKVVDAGGVNVKIARNAESALLSPSLAANGASRVAWLSGDVFADLGGNVPAEGAELITGYLVGCQIDITGLSAGIAGGVSLTGPSLGAAMTLPIAPGEVKFVELGSKSDLKPGVSAVQYRDQQLEVQGCGGHAEARAVSTVTVPGNHFVKSTLYGQPFSLG
ncbi:MspA family porin [Rhodococcus marinonascens]|uniref:MspA family porin n=1 Tax=Rhodococcus marinonascens TaxID=38311 RepID=UPI000932F0A4|nr:MspA family porin [Rhodococcus marinonascens]